MTFDPAPGREILARTPRVLDGWLRGLPDGWTRRNEGPGTWSPFDIVGHLVHGDRTDWIPRARHILQHGASRPFEPFDRFAQFEESCGKSFEDLLDEFAERRAESLAALDGMRLTAADMAREGRHPDFGPVTLGQLLATWVVHDLGHIAQIARVMAKREGSGVGPWRAYLPVLGDRERPGR